LRRTLVKKSRSFVPSDFSFRDTPYFLVAYLVASAICIGVGLAIESIPSFWRGLLAGVGLGFSVALILLYPDKKVDVDVLPKPSANVRAKCDDPDCSLVEAVKLYRDETGLSLAEATAVVKAYLAESQRRD
jgi:hypothetical protein